MIRHSGASAVLPFLDPLESEDPRVLLIRQFRHAANGFILEIPAGRLDPGEAPEACARRELEEEAGRRAGTLRHLTTFYTTPGFTDEKIHLFLATDLTETAHAREKDEFMELTEMRWSDVGRAVRDGRIVDGKTMVALMWVQAFVE
jgi:ADP-ribose pyrophosphatase